MLVERVERLHEMAAASGFSAGHAVLVKHEDGNTYHATVKKTLGKHSMISWDHYPDYAPEWVAHEHMTHRHAHDKPVLSPYQKFLTGSQQRQRGYIHDERRRYTKLEGLRQQHNPENKPFHEAPLAYKRAANALGLHPLTKHEISARHRQLDKMERDIPKTHGDSKRMRTIYEFHKETHR